MGAPKFMRLAQDEASFPEEETRRKGTVCFLFRLTFCMFGIGYAWAAQFARGASLFEDLGLSDDGVSLAFLAGPICGLIVQPIVGTLSDTTSTRCGRRRPWIVAGLGLVVASFLFLGESYFLGGLLGDTSTRVRPRGIAIAITAFWVLDFAQNAVQLPCRTLVSDVVRAEDVAAGNSMFAFFDGCGKLLSYTLASTSLADGEPKFATDARNQFAVAALVAAVSVGFTVATVSEPRHAEVRTLENRSVKNAMTHAWSLAFRVLFWRPATTKTTTNGKSSYELVVAGKKASVDELDYDPSTNLEKAQQQADANFETWSSRKKSQDDDDDDCANNENNEGGAKSLLFPLEDGASVRAAGSASAPASASSSSSRKRVGHHTDYEREKDFDEEDADDEDEEEDCVESASVNGAVVSLRSAATNPELLHEDLETLRRMCLAELGLWYGLSAWQVWGALLVGKSIFRGLPAAEAGAEDSPDVARFEDGVMLFSLGLAGANLLSLLLAPLYPTLLRRVGARVLMTVSALFMAVVMAALACLPAFLASQPVTFTQDIHVRSSFDLPWTRDTRFSFTVALLALLGLPWAAHMNVPFSVVGRAYQDAPEVGLYMATMNSSLCVAQLLMSFSTAFFLQATGSVAVCFAAGSLSGLFAAYHASKLTVPYDEADANANNNNKNNLPVCAAGH